MEIPLVLLLSCRFVIAMENNEHKVIKVMTCGFGIGISLGATSFEINTDDILPIFEDDEIFEEGLITNPNQLYEKK